jgi:hypothetical protein
LQFSELQILNFGTGVSNMEIHAFSQQRRAIPALLIINRLLLELARQRARQWSFIEPVRFVCWATTAAPNTTNKPNVATNLALRYLLPSSDEDQADALEGLTAVCLKALSDPPRLFLLPDDGTYENCAETTEWAIREATRDFVVGWIAEYFGPYYTQAGAGIRSAAQRDKFRHIGNACRSAVKNELERRKAKKRGGRDNRDLPDDYCLSTPAKDRPISERLVESGALELAQTQHLERALGSKPAATLTIILGRMAQGEMNSKGQAATPNLKAVESKAGSDRTSNAINAGNARDAHRRHLVNGLRLDRRGLDRTGAGVGLSATGTRPSTKCRLAATRTAITAEHRAAPKGRL